MIVDKYKFKTNNIPVDVSIEKGRDFVLNYILTMPEISKPTLMVLEKIRQDLIEDVSYNIVDITNLKKDVKIDDELKKTIDILVTRYFPEMEQEVHNFLVSYLIQRSIGLGNIEFLMHDKFLEEITINGYSEPIWVYHIKHGWIKTNIKLDSEDQIKHYAAMIGRKVGRQLTALRPLLDAYLKNDRVNATLSPISTKGNTITIRKFSRDPWTITRLLESRTINYEAASLIWLAMQYEVSALVIGGTASGKTSAMNVLACFIPPNQRIISIEDTRELQLPVYLHWVPLLTRMSNAEGKGIISMEDLLVNSLRMRPDRIVVGEVRRKQEASTLFEAVHTGHSVYSTFHANNAEEALNRLTNVPIEVPLAMIPAVGLIITQFRNRATGSRRTSEIVEITKDGKPRVLMKYDFKKDELVKVNDSKVLLQHLTDSTGLSLAKLKSSMKEKQKILKYLVKKKISTVHEVGEIIAQYYSDPAALLKKLR